MGGLPSGKHRSCPLHGTNGLLNRIRGSGPDSPLSLRSLTDTKSLSESRTIQRRIYLALGTRGSPACAPRASARGTRRAHPKAVEAAPGHAPVAAEEKAEQYDESSGAT